MSARYSVFALVAVALGIALAGCGSGGGATSGSTTTTGAAQTSGPPPAQSQGSFVSSGVPANEEVGRVVVSEIGNTLYHFQKDQRNSGKSACYGACTKVWVPYTTKGKPQAERYARASLVGTIKRDDGTTQVTYAGWPLYTHPGEGPALLDGDGLNSFGARWYAVAVDGKNAPN